jgi:GDP-D-mannose dehydratase
MRVFVVGASGAIGSRLVPQLVRRGHQVIGTSRSGAGAERIRALGAKPIVLDLLDPRAVRKAVRETDPDAIVHQATALADLTDLKHFDRSFAQTNRLRTEGTETLLAAPREASADSSPRATPACGTSASAARSRARTTRSTRRLWPRRAPSASWAGSSVTRTGARALPRPTRRSTGRLTRSPTGRNRVPCRPESDDAISAP